MTLPDGASAEEASHLWVRVECGWRGTAVHDNPRNVMEGMETAIAFLIKQILKQPKNELRLNVPDRAEFTFEIPDVDIG